MLDAALGDQADVEPGVLPISVEMTWPSPVSLERCSAAPTPAIGPEWIVCSASVEFICAMPPELWITIGLS